MPYPWLIVEEPELGLHPEGIMVAMGALLELLSIPSQPPLRLCISTHSNAVLDVVWALRQFQGHAASHRLVLRMLGLPSTPELETMAQRLLQKKFAVYYFDRNTGTTSDISNLDPGSADSIEAGWGGLTGWSGEIGNLVAAAVSMSESAE
ncbi:MAG: ATP-binding protein [Bryobacterales bacterium]|nr:ATP-binding protein [Bryobacterales bacterium]